MDNLPTINEGIETEETRLITRTLDFWFFIYNDSIRGEPIADLEPIKEAVQVEYRIVKDNEYRLMTELNKLAETNINLYTAFGYYVKRNILPYLPTLTVIFNQLYGLYNTKINYTTSILYEGVDDGGNVRYTTRNFLNNDEFKGNNYMLGYLFTLFQNREPTKLEYETDEGGILWAPVQVTVRRLTPMGKIVQTKKGGRFCKMKNTSSLDLSSLQIYKDITEYNHKHCIISSLEYFGVEVSLEQIEKYIMKNKELKFNKSHLDELSMVLNIPITITELTANNRISVTKYPLKGKKLDRPFGKVRLAYKFNHYFPNDYILYKGKYKFGLTPAYLKELGLHGKCKTLTLINKLEELGFFKEELDYVHTRFGCSEEMTNLSILDKEQKSCNMVTPQKMKFGEFTTNDVIRGKADYSDNKRRERLANICIKNHPEMLPLLKNNIGEPDEKWNDLALEHFFKVGKYACDIESMFYTPENTTKKVHVPYSIMKVNKYDKYSHKLIKTNLDNIFSTDMMNNFYNSFPEWSINYLEFHNAKYDFSVMKVLGIPNVESVVIKEGNLYQIELNYHNRIFIIQDTFKKVSMSLANGAKMLGIKNRKIEYTPYDLYTVDNMKLHRIPITEPILNTYTSIYKVNREGCELELFNNNGEYIQLSNVLVRKEWLERIEKKYIIEENNNKYFKHIDYYDDYLHMDCEVLRQMMHAFDAQMTTIMGRHYFNHKLTISAIADTYLHSKECYRKAYQVTGHLLNFLRNCTKGGRVCTARNNKIHTFQEYPNPIRIIDSDATALYPSAMIRLTKELGGIPVGKAKLITNIEEINNLQTGLAKVEELRKLGYYAVKINITNITKEWDLPVLCIKNKEGIVDWTNNVLNREIYVEYFTLRDFCKYQGGDFTLLEGCYWDEFDNKFCEEVSTLFGERQKAKEAKALAKTEGRMEDFANFDALQLTLKLLLNSLYGKTILKKSDNNIVAVSSNKYQQYMINNFNRIPQDGIESFKHISTSSENPTKQYLIKVSNEDAHFNLQHIGMCILGCSKAIVNEYIEICNEVGARILYSDTDSLHIIVNYNTDENNYEEAINNNLPYSDLEDKIREIYLAKYGRELYGDKPGQFTSDFEVAGYSDIYSKGMIATGKKEYLHLLRGRNSEGIWENIPASNSFTFKGIPPKAFKAHANKHYNNDYRLMFQDIYEDKDVNVDMLADGAHFSFEFSSEGVSHKERFSRKISGKGNLEIN